MAPCRQALPRLSPYTGKSSQQEVRSSEPCGHSLLLAWVTLGKPLTLLPWFSDFKMGVPAPSSTSPGWCDGIRENGSMKLPLCSKATGPRASTPTAPSAAPDDPQGVVKSRAQTQRVKWRGQTTTQGYLQSQGTVHSTIFLQIIRTFGRLCYATHMNGQLLSAVTDLPNQAYCIWLHMH